MNEFRRFCSCRRTVCVDGTLTLRRCSPVATSPPASCVLSYSRAICSPGRTARVARECAASASDARSISIDRPYRSSTRPYRSRDRSRELDRSVAIGRDDVMGTHTHGRRRTPLKSLIVNGRTMAHGASGPDTTHECPRVGSDIWHTQSVRFEWFTTMLGAAIPSIDRRGGECVGCVTASRRRRGGACVRALSGA